MSLMITDFSHAVVGGQYLFEAKVWKQNKYSFVSKMVDVLTLVCLHCFRST